MSIAYIGIGSNLNPIENIQRLVLLLESYDSTCRFSRFYESVAIGVNAPNFVNGVVEVNTNKNLQDFADYLKQLEGELGRGRESKGAHTHEIDLDLLLFDDVISKTKPILPRRDIFKFPFVLQPLFELCPDKIIIGDGRSVAKLKQQLFEKMVGSSSLKPIDIAL